MVVDYLADMEEQGSTMAMDVDDVDAIDMFGEGPLGSGEHLRLADADFFNCFQDDFDDSDINWIYNLKLFPLLKTTICAVSVP